MSRVSQTLAWRGMVNLLLHRGNDMVITRSDAGFLQKGRAMERYPTDRASLERDCQVAFFIASGPGGQHRNKVETGVRLIHQPSGLTVTATERRSQSANRERAFERMAARLQAVQRRQTPRVPTRPSQASRERRLQTKRRISLSKQRRTTAAHGEE